MRAVQISNYGGPEVLSVVELADPAPGAGEVLIRVEAAGINFAEVKMREGNYAMNPDLPGVLGSEVVGRIEALGPDVVGIEAGALVAAPLFAAGAMTGGYAELVTIPAGLVVPVPDGVAAATAAALQVQGLTASFLLRQSPVAGRTVLVQAAAGGVGSLLVQLARRAGASRVLAAASTEAKRDLAISLGADAGIDYTRADWPDQVREQTGGAGADVIFDTGSGPPALALDALAPGGEMVVYGSLSLGSFALGGADVGTLVFKNLSIRGFALPTLLTPEGLRTELTSLLALAAGGELRTLPVAEYPLERASDAHRALEGRATTGKLVLVP